MLDRRDFLKSSAIPFLGVAAPTFAAAVPAGFPAAQPERALFPTPADGATVGINPPGFAWWRAPGKAIAYRLIIQDRTGRRIYEAAGLPDPVHVPNRTLAPGNYAWDVAACDASGKEIARRGLWKFTVPENIPLLPWEDPKAILARVPDDHPRCIFLKKDLDALRATLKTTRRRAWESLEAQADRALKTPLPEPPRYHTFDTPARRRMGYTRYFRNFRGRVDAVLAPLSLAWLLSGDERYGQAAKRLLLTIEPWGIEGPMSLLSPYGDEPGLSMSRHGAHAYDWLYPLFSESERARIRAMTTGRARQILQRLRRSDYLAAPAESHNGRLIAYLAEHAIVLKDEVPDAAEWLDYSLRALMTFYPHWGDADGGWAEGVSYALAYNTIYLGALEALRAIGLDLYKRPFFRNVRKFFLYCTSPIGEIKPFGDGAERGGVGSTGAALLAHHGRRFNDPHCIWWARQAGDASAGDPMVALVTEDTVKPEPPTPLPTAAVFRGIGWAGLHSALDNPKEDTFFIFKSSPYGSVSHSHADQNSFCILKGGRALAIPSGYYGPAYGMPHHAQWTRQTKANNCVLVNGEGQIVRAASAAGRIAAFQHQKAITYLCGDAAPAYGGKLKRFLRHVLFLRPGVFVLLDELESPAPAEYSWLLHAFDQMQVDEGQSTVISTRRGAALTVRLASEAGLTFSQTDVFDTPYNEGNPQEYHEKVENHWHFTAQTNRRAAAARIAAAMTVLGPSEKLDVEWRQADGWLGIALQTPDGTGEAWVQMSPGARPPLAAATSQSLLAAVWRPRKGEEERLVIGT